MRSAVHVYIYNVLTNASPLALLTLTCTLSRDSRSLSLSPPFTEDELSLTSSQMQQSSPQSTASAYSLNSQAPNFVTSHMLGQTYATENSNFGPIYHQTHHHSTLPYSYDKMYKIPPTSSPTNVYQHYHQGFYGHGMMRQVDYPAIKHL